MTSGQQFLQRRRMLGAATGAGVLSYLAHAPASAQGTGSWLPYAPGEVRVLQPRSSADFASTVQAFLPTRGVEMGAQRGRAFRTPVSREPSERLFQSVPGSELRSPPTAYRLTAQRVGVPDWLLFGVALQESKMAFGKAVLPYPWTLCVRGSGERHASYDEALEALRRYVNAGVTNVDCGAMQVNWYWHRSRLQSPEQALDPYPNLTAGAQILREHFQGTDNWFKAVALYHAGSITPDSRERAGAYANGVFTRLARMGVDTRSWQPATGIRDV